jgi:hypothetical protein
MSSGARHSLAAEACLAAHERRKCGEGSRVKDWIVYAQHCWEGARAARTIVANVSREGADGLAETGMGAVEPAVTTTAGWKRCVIMGAYLRLQRRQEYASRCWMSRLSLAECKAGSAGALS